MQQHESALVWRHVWIIINLSLQKGIQKGERFQKTYTPMHSKSSALGKMKAITVIKAISKYLHICNKIKIIGFSSEKKNSQV